MPKRSICALPAWFRCPACGRWLCGLCSQLDVEGVEEQDTVVVATCSDCPGLFWSLAWAPVAEA